VLLFIRIGALNVSFVSMRRLVDDEPEGFTGGMTLRKAISFTKVSRATAWRDLSELVEQQAIEPIGEGRSRAYRIHWPSASETFAL